MAKILVVDDDDLLRETVRLVLEKAGHRVAEAQDGRKVPELLAGDTFDIMLLDMVMRGKGGIETLADPALSSSSCKVIVMTGRIDTGSEAFQALCRRFNAEAVLAKPFTTRQLLETIEALVPGQP